MTLRELFKDMPAWVKVGLILYVGWACAMGIVIGHFVEKFW